ncbi:unnamed protein product [Caenorhabditis auriculariae]|uniref:Uncharacterized protein n=1 Tax=Caenorhabditis auriculariae TaxID=2777116 RepID=A0A8S1H1K4_9PELO|nr:unnamed protein product [Caenorhabditis auriculariae]
MLFSRRKTAAVEGTQGRYVKRDAPPPVPSLSASAHAVNAARRSPISTAALAAAAAQTLAQTIPEPEFLQMEDPSYNEVFDDTFDIGENLAVEPARRLHSRSTVSENDGGLEGSDEIETSPSTSFGLRNIDVLSSRSFNRGGLRFVPRKALTASHSIGNVEQGLLDISLRDELSTGEQPRSKKYGDITSVHDDDPFVDEPTLPPNWAIDYTNDGIRYYVDHNNRRTHWVHPLVKDNLRPGWKKYFDPQLGVIYFNETTGVRQFDHPGIANPIFRTESVNVASRSNMELTADLHIIQENELPPWLLMYAQSDTSLDHLLEWNLFGISQLAQYEEMMRKLYKQQAIDIARKYEKMRVAINREIHRRDASRPPPRRM